MNKNILLIFLYFCYINSLFSQYTSLECAGDIEDSVVNSRSISCTNISNDFILKYRLQDSYIPNVSNFIDEIKIPFNLIILADGDGSKGAYSPAEWNNLDKSLLLSWLNRAFENTSLPSDPVIGLPSTYWLNDIKIRFVFNEIYFYNDSLMFNSEYPNGVNLLRTHHLSENPKAINFINCYLVKNGFPDAGGYTSSGNNGQEPHVVSRGWNNPNGPGYWTGDYWYWAEHLPHEFGHRLGLMHTYAPGGCCSESSSGFDFLSDVFFDPFQYEQPCPSGGASESSTDFCTNNLMSGHPFSWFISPLQAGRAHRELRTGIIRHFAFGYSNIPHEIFSNEKWDFTYKSYNDIIIKSGSILTITCRLEMVEGSKIIIEPNAKLILDGGIITSARSSNFGDSYWQGIEVWGTSTKNQYPQGAPTYQGILIVKNGGTIENAHVGATNWKPNDYDAIGGVIQATDAIFRNNRVDVGFVTYQNFAPSKPNIKVGNHSFFRNTEFFSDNDYIEGFPQRDAHVTMWDVDGISFMNCHFANNVTTDKDNSTAPMRGIYSINAGYKVEAGCDYPFLPVGQPCPSEDLLKSSFSGFNMAMEASGASTSYTVRVEQSEFSDNLWNILIEEMDNVSINRNEIEVADAGYTLTGSNTGAGIVIDASTGYIVEENTLTTNFSNPVDFGIFIGNSGEDDNRVYKNSINGYEYGSLATGVNHNTGYSKGLQFLCNDFEENGKAIYIGFTTQNDDGIRYNQGDFVSLYYPLYITSSAGNTFINNTMDIENYTSAIRYFYKGANAEPINNSGPITVEEATFAHTCLTSFGGSVIMKSSGNGLDSLSSVLENYTLAYNNLNYTLHTLIDDGNTEELKEYIENYWSSDAWTLRGNLLEKSPYLSREALLDAASLGILPNGMLLEILLANPDATKGERFLQELDESTHNTFPAYMKDYVRNNYDALTLRTQLEGQIASIYTQLVSTRNFVKNIRNLAETYSYQERLETASMGNNLSQKTALMDFFIENLEFEKADSVLQTVKTDKRWKDNTSFINQMDNYITFRASLGSRNLAQLTVSEIDYLQILAGEEGRVAGYAQNILCFFYGICYEKNLLPNTPQQKPTSFTSNTAELNNILYNVKVYPNPASSYTSISWEIYDNLKDAGYSVVDLSGREQLQGKLSSNQGEEVIDTRGFKQGVYIITIYNNGELKVSRKLVVERE